MCREGGADRDGRVEGLVLGSEARHSELDPSVQRWVGRPETVNTGLFVDLLPSTFSTLSHLGEEGSGARLSESEALRVGP